MIKKIIALSLTSFLLFSFIPNEDRSSFTKENQSLSLEAPFQTAYPPYESEAIHSDFLDESSHPGWELIFQDEFNRDSLDKTSWTALNRKDNYNNELQEYSSKNVKVERGRLNLIAKKDEQRSKYTSGLVDTKGHFSFRYGKVEVKARHPEGTGLFPAIWMLRADGKDHLPEIDIFESIGDDPNVVYQVHHWSENGQLKTDYSNFTIDTHDKDHIYGIEWEPDELRWYIDDRLVFTSRENIPDTPMYLLINLAIGGNWPGQPNEDTHFPSSFSIEFVKIYKKARN